MFGKYTIAELGALLSDPSRVEILTYLLDGSHHPAGALALAAGLSPQAASAHLAKLARGGLVRVTRSGRTRLFELSRPEIGHMLEALGAATSAKPQARQGQPSLEAMTLARTCFRERGIDTFSLRCQRRAFVRGCLDWTERQPHVGGALGAAWLEHCLVKGWAKRMKGTRALRISNDGREAFRQLLGFEIPRPAGV